MKAYRVVIPMIVLAGQMFVCQLMVTSMTEKHLANAGVYQTIATARVAK